MAAWRCTTSECPWYVLWFACAMATAMQHATVVLPSEGLALVMSRARNG